MQRDLVRDQNLLEGAERSTVPQSPTEFDQPLVHSIKCKFAAIYDRGLRTIGNAFSGVITCAV